MLSMDDIKYIKRLYEKEGISVRKIMKRTGVNGKYFPAKNGNYFPALFGK